MKNEGFAIVTGSARGIGAALAKQCGKEGYNTVVNYVSDSSKEKAEEVAETIRTESGVKAIVVQADVSTYEGCKKIVDAGVEAFGDKIAVLVNNAGIDWVGDFLEEPIDMIERMIQTNLMSQLYMVKLVLPYMVAQQYGHIIGIASNAAIMGNTLIDYSASKAGVTGLTRALAYTYAKDNIHVNAIAPGMFETQMVTEADPDVRAFYMSLVPLNRIGKLAELQDLLHYLVNTDFCTGQVLSPNGGTAM